MTNDSLNDGLSWSTLVVKLAAWWRCGRRCCLNGGGTAAGELRHSRRRRLTRHRDVLEPETPSGFYDVLETELRTCRENWAFLLQGGRGVATGYMGVYTPQNQSK